MTDADIRIGELEIERLKQDRAALQAEVERLRIECALRDNVGKKAEAERDEARTLLQKCHDRIRAAIRGEGWLLPSEVEELVGEIETLLHDADVEWMREARGKPGWVESSSERILPPDR